jgi:hypothetical protein
MKMRQLPTDDEIFLDHIAHFVPDLEKAAVQMKRAGFVLTPFTRQQNRTLEGMVATGMANHCIMLDQGYVELLTKVSPSPLSDQFTTAVHRYVGLHLIAFATDKPDEAFHRLAAEGFSPVEPVELTRPVEDAKGTTHTARFTVMRVDPAKMLEGRIQVLKHHTPDIVWQTRWTQHPNAIVALAGVLISVDDPETAAARFGRFVGCKPERRDNRYVLPLARGGCAFATPVDIGTFLPGSQSHGGQPPRIVASSLASRDHGCTAEHFAKGDIPRLGSAGSTYRMPDTIGGFVSVVSEGAAPDWLS